MITLPGSLKSWRSPEFDATFKREVSSLESTLLPLQQGLSQSSYVSDSAFNVVVLSSSEAADALNIKSGIFYAGINTGSCCADDPTPLDEITEYIEINVEINKITAEAIISLLQEA